MTKDALRDRVGRWQWGQQDRIIDHALLSDRWISDPLLKALEAIQAVSCALLGHRPIEDNCGRPDHDYCAWCHNRTPGKAKR